MSICHLVKVSPVWHTNSMNGKSYLNEDLGSCRKIVKVTVPIS